MKMPDVSTGVFPLRKVITLGIATVFTLMLVISSSQLVENLDAEHVMVIQSPINGDLVWHTTPGIKWQGFGKVTVYNKRSQFWFSAKSDQGTTGDQSISVRFNDGGHANISGSLSWENPTSEELLKQLHTKYGSQQAVDQQLVRTVVEKAVYMAGPLMSSKESYAEKRNDLLTLIEDQIQHGVFQTETTSEKQRDSITGTEKTVNIVSVKKDKSGNPLRSDNSPLQEFGIRTFNLSINNVKYDDTVDKQIAAQQQAVMQVQTAIMESRRAEQEAITVAKQGEANAAKTKWAQEALKAQAVTLALQEKEVATTKADQEKVVAETAARRDLEVAKLATAQAEQYKQAQLMKAEGDAEYKKRVMEADGALAQKLAAMVEINKSYADAIQKYQGAWVPNVMMGSANGNAPASSALSLVELLTVKTARDLALDMEVSKQPAHKK